MAAAKGSGYVPHAALGSKEPPSPASPEGRGCGRSADLGEGLLPVHRGHRTGEDTERGSVGRGRGALGLMVQVWPGQGRWFAPSTYARERMRGRWTELEDPGPQPLQGAAGSGSSTGLVASLRL